MPKFINLTRANEIGGNSYYLGFGDQGVVLDSGMHPKHDGTDALPGLPRIDHLPVDAIFLSHAHHDHVGSLPLLAERHPDAPIFMSEPTYFLADPLLHNSVNVMKRQQVELDIREYPFYTHQDVTRLTKRWQACHLNKRWSVRGWPITDGDKKNDPLSFIFHPAGHILGSVGVELEYRGQRIFYTGDVNFHDQTLLKGAVFPSEGIDVLITETTRGAQPTPEGHTRETAGEALLQALNETYDKGGSVLMPIFAMGKTQELLAFLHQARLQRRIPQDTFFIGGLGRNFSEVYDRQARSGERKSPSLQILEDIQPQVLDWKAVNDFRPRRHQLFLLPSGMMTGNTTSNRFAKYFLARPENSIFFVGYTDPDSPAGKLRARARGEKVEMDGEFGEQPVTCRVQHFDFTSHATRESILGYIQKLNPRHTILVHGDTPALEWFRNELQSSCPDMKVTIPPPGVEIDL